MIDDMKKVLTERITKVVTDKVTKEVTGLSKDGIDNL